MKTKLIAGNNILQVCPATMQAVVQAWLNEELASPVEVTAVHYDSTRSRFDITFKRATEQETSAEVYA